jgi:hypothetical protein
MMSGFHGLFSLGGIVGAAGTTALLGAGASPLTATLIVIAGIVVALASSLRWQWPLRICSRMATRARALASPFRAAS